MRIYLNFRRFAVELAPSPKPGGVMVFRYGERPPRRWWLFGRRLTPAEVRRRERRRTRLAPHCSLEMGPIALSLHLPMDRPRCIVVQGDAGEARVHEAEWTTSRTLVVWIPLWESDEPLAHLRAQKLDPLGREADPTVSLIEVTLDRAPVEDPHNRWPPRRLHGYPSEIELPMPGAWRFEVEVGERTVTLTAAIAEP